MQKQEKTDRRNDIWEKKLGGSNVKETARVESLETNDSQMMGVGGLEKRLLRDYAKMAARERDKLLTIFRDIADDPNWFEESVMFHLYEERIPVTEFFSLLSSDDQQSHLANKK